MKIIGGTASGIELECPKGLSVRPTAARAKKSLFDSLGNFEEKTVIDMFAGIGGLGLEAVSRGASNVYFIENDKKNCEIIAKNIDKVKRSGVKSNMHILCSNAINAHKNLSSIAGKIDIIFADPPYQNCDEYITTLLSDLQFAQWAKNAVFILESPTEYSRKPSIENIKLWDLQKFKKLGQSIFYFFINGYCKADIK